MISIRRPPRWLSARVDAVAAHLDRLAPPPPLLARAIAKLAGGVTQLPSAPPSTLVAAAINRALWPRFPPELRDGLAGRVVAMEITDLGVRVRLCAGPRGFSAAGEQAVAALRVASRTSGWWRLARGLDDPDRLFFDRVLMMEGDTELGLLLKNSLDALGPLWPVATAQEQR